MLEAVDKGRIKFFQKYVFPVVLGTDIVLRMLVYGAYLEYVSFARFIAYFAGKLLIVFLRTGLEIYFLRDD